MTTYRIPFNKPFTIGKELEYIRAAVDSGKISGNGLFTQRCHAFFEETLGFRKCLLTTSCTSALEMAALLVDVRPGDEIIVPSFAYVSTANAFVMRGAKVVFADSEQKTPNLDVSGLESLVTERTKAIVPVHYGGIACDMDGILAVADRHDLFVIEDAAQAVDACHNGKPLGGIGHFGAMSFHETKNVLAGEGGALFVNDERMAERAEIIWEKGTNRLAFQRGEVDEYSWVDLGSSYLPSELVASFLYAQLERMDDITTRRQAIWEMYREGLADLERDGVLQLPFVPEYSTNNGHIFYLICRSREERENLLDHLKGQGILAVSHYLSLHRSPFYRDRHSGVALPRADRYADCLARLPVFYELSDSEVAFVLKSVRAFYA
jgi:dTDP-4-amino-4,6-dideoxygalactose transaminase